MSREEEEVVFERKGKWFFWSEHYDEHGPYRSKEEAEKAFRRYCEESLGP